jgi:DNA-binding transcriptional regulator YhcF (GntR family)
MEKLLLSVSQLAVREGCSESLIRKRFREMERSGLYPKGVKQLGGIKINVEQFEDYIYRRRRETKNEK